MTTENSNLKLWELAQGTDPAFTKGNNNGGRQETTINGHYMVREATRHLGPAGVAWGWEELEERFDLDYHFKQVDTIFKRVFG